VGFKVVSRLQKAVKWTISTNGIGKNGSMTDLPQKPIHPGEVLGEVYLKSFQPAVTVSDFADSINVSSQELTNFIAGKCPVTMALAARLAMRFRTTTAYWLGLQALYDKRSQAAKFQWVSHQAKR
jgi:addiction module HigA family antidote